MKLLETSADADRKFRQAAARTTAAKFSVAAAARNGHETAMDARKWQRESRILYLVLRQIKL